jgi:hypothetical protein
LQVRALQRVDHLGAADWLLLDETSLPARLLDHRGADAARTLDELGLCPSGQLRVLPASAAARYQ